jgi:hypothetical protein
MRGATADHPVSHDDVERIAGYRIDRRRNYAIINGEVCSLVRFTEKCSGCVYPDGTCGGCEECGFTGKRINEMYLPHDPEVK